MSPNQQPNPPEHVVAVAQRMLALAWLSDATRSTVEANVARMRAQLEER